jgi:hypothetical protein
VTCDCCYDNSAIDPLRDFRDHYLIYLSDVDGVIWASNSFWAVPVPNSQHQIARLLAAYNLPLEPATLEVRDTLGRHQKLELKDIKALVLDAIPAEMQKVSPVSFNGAQVYVKGTQDDNQWLAVFDIPGGVAVVDDDRLRLVERMAPEGEWYASSDPNAMFVRKTEDGRVTAVLMPMRHRASDK